MDLENPKLTDNVVADDGGIVTSEEGEGALADATYEEHNSHCPNLLDAKLDVCEEVLDKKMQALELNENGSDIIKTNGSAGGGDGSDSGVETGCGITMDAGNILQRAFSSNSAGYASSSGGLEEHIGAVSCNSSMISYSSDVGEKPSLLTMSCGPLDYCASEGGSESSSVTGGPTSIRKNPSNTKKKVAVKEPPSTRAPRKTPELLTTPPIRSRSKGPGLGRSNSLSTKTGPPMLATKERARSREKPPTVMTTSAVFKTPTTSTPNKPAIAKKPVKPDSLPTGIRDLASPSTQRAVGARTPSATRTRTPGATPTTDDGRWPSIQSRTNVSAARQQRGTTMAPETLTIKTKVGNIALENNKLSANTFDKYATLPRRRKEKSSEELKESRSNSSTRENIANRMTMSLVKRQTSKDTPTTPSKTLPAYPKTTMTSRKPIVPQRTIIYHETGCQTAITSKDVADAFAGNPRNVRVEASEMITRETQSDIRDKEMEKMEEKVAKINTEYSQLLNKMTEKSQMISSLEQELLREREEKLAAQRELQNNADRVLGMLESYHSTPIDENGGGDSLLMLESQLQNSGTILEKQQSEISKLRHMCRTLQNDMEKSLKNQQNLIHQKNELEEESAELQDFLQAEKVSFMEALKDAENEILAQKQKILQNKEDLDKQQEDSRHLVRISEQRRQEYLGLLAKYRALENRSKQILKQHGSAVSGATVALSGLGSRLHNLVEQLITSYNISEQDLEDLVFHNEAYCNSASGSSEDASPECETGKPPLSPKRGHSFVMAVISAIKSAATTAKQSVGGHKINHDDESESTEMLDSETEPCCLMMDNVLEDVTMPDSHSHNLVSTSSQLILSQIEAPSDLIKDEDTFNNLSQAIVNRQQIEFETSIMSRSNPMIQSQILAEHSNSVSEDASCHDSIAEMPSMMGDYCTAQTLVDQVIDVDNLVTKLLKVLRIIQMDNDNSLMELINDRNQLAISKDDNCDKLRDTEELNEKLQAEIKRASEDVILKSNELAISKSELIKHRNEINKLNEDICNLSTLCNQNNVQPNKQSLTKEEIFNSLKSLLESGTLPEQELISQIISSCNEIPALKEKLMAKEQHLKEMSNNKRNVMTSSLRATMNEAKRQYDAIDRALETLNSIQSIVQQCPALQQLQQDLEETNFQSASSLPISLNTTADLNANPSSAAGLPITNENAGILRIDSTA